MTKDLVAMFIIGKYSHCILKVELRRLFPKRDYNTFLTRINVSLEGKAHICNESRVHGLISLFIFTSSTLY